MKHNTFIALLALCSTNVFACNSIVAEYSIESSNNIDKIKRSMALETPEVLFNSIIDGVRDIHSRSCSREKEDNLIFLSCSLTKDNKTRGFASVLSPQDVNGLLQVKNITFRNSFGSPTSNYRSLTDLRDNLFNICDDINVDYTYMRNISPFERPAS